MILYCSLICFVPWYFMRSNMTGEWCPVNLQQQDVSPVSPCKQFLTVRWLKRDETPAYACWLALKMINEQYKVDISTQMEPPLKKKNEITLPPCISMQNKSKGLASRFQIREIIILTYPDPILWHSPMVPWIHDINGDGAMVRSSPALAQETAPTWKTGTPSWGGPVLMANREYLLGNIQKAVETGAKKTTLGKHRT